MTQQIVYTQLLEILPEVKKQKCCMPNKLQKSFSYFSLKKVLIHFFVLDAPQEPFFCDSYQAMGSVKRNQEF